MSLQLFSEKIFAVMETYEELTARWTKAVAEMEATVDEYQELEKEEVELVEQMIAHKDKLAQLVEQMTAHKAKLLELEAKCCEKDKDKTALKEHLRSLEKMAMTPMWWLGVRRYGISSDSPTNIFGLATHNMWKCNLRKLVHPAFVL